MKYEPSKKPQGKPFAKPFAKSSRKPFVSQRDVVQSETKFEKPVYKGKVARLSGVSRNETRERYSKYPKVSPYKKDKESGSLPSSADSGSLRSQASRNTSWGSVANWYDKHLEKGDDTYHEKVVFPNLVRLLGDIKGKKILDLACGQGIFSEQLRDKGAFVTGVDISKELIKIAEDKSKTIKEKGTHKVTYHISSSDDLFMLKDKSFDIVICILAIQNIENLQKTISEVKRVLTEKGKFIFVLNHPSFRNPKQTYWGYSEEEDKQYRRVDEYMSESHVKIDMAPGSIKDKKFTVSFHRPLQVYIKALSKYGFAVTHLEEWVSHRESERGKRKIAEDKARKEIPLFMCIESKII